MASNGGYSIYVDAELNLEKLKKDLQAKGLKLPVEADASGLKNANNEIGKMSDGIDDARESAEDFSTTWQQAASILNTCVEIVGKLSEQVFELDEAQIEFQKVSDLSGKSLDSYTDKLSDMGKEVARTGKPNRSEPVCCDGKAA